MENNKNLKEFKELMERYASVTLEEIQIAADVFSSNRFLAQFVAARLTGYGSTQSCTLCKAIPLLPYLQRRTGQMLGCSECTWQSSDEDLHCMRDKQYHTYHNITESNSPIELLEAFRARAAYMSEYLKLLEHGD